LSIDDISFPSALESSLAAESTSVIPITAITLSLDSNTAGNSPDTPTQKALHPEDDPGAKTDLGLSSGLGDDLTSLLKDLTSGNTSAAKADISKVQADLQTKEASSVADAQTGGPLETLIGKISDSLDSGSVQGAPQDGALQDLADFLVENGQGTGSLINTSA
jgi:hypothetical protein